MIDEIITTVSTFESQAKVNDSKIFLGHKTSAVFHRDLHYEPFRIASASGIHFHFTNGQKVVDATGGAAVSCIGHGDPRVRDAISAQFDALDYCHSMFFSCPSSEELCQALIDTTNGQMAKAYIVCSGVSSPTARKFAPRTNQCCWQVRRQWRQPWNFVANTLWNFQHPNPSELVLLPVNNPTMGLL